MNHPASPLRPDRIRIVQKPFAWIPFRLLTDGHLASLSDPAKLLYLLLCLAADRNGLSFYGDKRILSYFQLDHRQLELARSELIEKDLIAYDGRLYQVLSLPERRNQLGQHARSPRRDTAGQPDRLSVILARIAKRIE